MLSLPNLAAVLAHKLLEKLLRNAAQSCCIRLGARQPFQVRDEVLIKRLIYHHFCIREGRIKIDDQIGDLETLHHAFYEISAQTLLKLCTDVLANLSRRRS